MRKPSAIKYFTLSLPILISLLVSCGKGSKPVITPERPDPSSTTTILGFPSQSTEEASVWTAEQLLIKKEYTVSYLLQKGIPRWVGWHLQTSDLGDVDRQDDFRLDEELPTTAVRVRPTDYTGSGFDRGHLCPSGDRTSSVAANSATFLMTNMIPQAPALNRGVWNDLEEYCRTKVKLGYEAYIYAGGHQEGGTGSNGTANTIANGKISVPQFCWKVVLIMPEGTDDLKRIASEKVEVIAVLIPNSQDVAGTGWRRWQLTVRQLEQVAKLNFFSELPQAVQDKIEN
ncbi:DNA/RNA non-specific endonuclease [Siphonobacter curvatus]|uniref:Endonuclease n=1 Tax=Siphonobacter curvatus TaxID=2094562 RepID=A0A2S7IEM7_9BACT|nr:DNA/RNA non-specific endonuclease [Siphonobacter curvatus]PQA52999.1 hypothetical protein C5O19_25250 [Siphonobacter curvatus]